MHYFHFPFIWKINRRTVITSPGLPCLFAKFCTKCIFTTFCIYRAMSIIFGVCCFVCGALCFCVVRVCLCIQSTKSIECCWLLVLPYLWFIKFNLSSIPICRTLNVDHWLPTDFYQNWKFDRMFLQIFLHIASGCLIVIVFDFAYSSSSLWISCARHSYVIFVLVFLLFINCSMFIVYIFCLFGTLKEYSQRLFALGALHSPKPCLLFAFVYYLWISALKSFLPLNFIFSAFRSSIHQTYVRGA